MEPKFDNAYVLNVTAEDRPGIVAAVSQAVAAGGGNIDAASQTVLGGYFTLIMIVSFPAPPAEKKLLDDLVRPDGQDSGLGVNIRPYRPEADKPVVPDGENFVITCFGPDAPGVICRFSSLLAEKGINIVDLYGQLDGEQFVLISPADAAKRNIREGDPVRVYNDRGDFEGVAKVTDDVNPGIVVATLGYWRSLNRSDGSVNSISSEVTVLRCSSICRITLANF